MVLTWSAAPHPPRKPRTLVRLGQWRRRHERRPMPVLNERQVPYAGLPTPAPNLLRTNCPAPRNLRHRRARPTHLGNNPRLLLVQPTPPPARTSQNLNPPKPCLRVVVNSVHRDRSMPKLCIGPAQIIRSQEEGTQRPAYVSRLTVRTWSSQPMYGSKSRAVASSPSAPEPDISGNPAAPKRLASAAHRMAATRWTSSAGMETPHTAQTAHSMAK